MTLLSHASTFSGIGGIDLGFERNGFQTVAQVEIDQKCQQVLARHFPNVPRYGDISQVKGEQLVPADGPLHVLSGGFPCQDLSVAGKRRGLAGSRSGLFYEFCRVAEEAQPQWIVLENVPGLLSSNGGRDMGAVLGTLAELGYGFAYRVLDAQYFGVAQRRRRVFIVGHLGDADGPREVLLEPEGVRWDPPTRREEGEAVAALTANGVGTCGADDNQAQAGHIVLAHVPEIVPQAMSCKWAKGTSGPAGDEHHNLVAFQQPEWGVRWDPPTRREARSGPAVTPVASTLTGGGKRGYRVDAESAAGGHLIPTHEVSPCLQERGYKGVDSDMTQAHVVRLDDVAVRRLTPTECERLQGFPDGWTDGQSDSARYRQLGNAVCVNVAEWVGRRLAEVIRRGV